MPQGSGGVVVPSRKTPGCWAPRAGCQAGASLLLYAGGSMPGWKPLLLPNLGPGGALLSPGLPAQLHGFSTSYLQSFAHVLPPQEAFLDCSGSSHGSSNNTCGHVPGRVASQKPDGEDVLMLPIL